MQAGAYRNYLLSVLLAILAFNYVDRLALGISLQDIKSDLQMTDTQLGLLSGIAFAMFYSIMGVPIARWADRGDRTTIIALTTALWSVAVVACGMARTFLQLMLVRVWVAVGEAGCVPPAHSLIADYFTRAERPRAVARYMLGAPLSVIIGYFLAGWLNELYGWRMTFTTLGLPGLVLSGLAWLTVREPRRDRTAGLNGTPAPSATTSQRESAVLPAAQPSLKEVWSVLSAKRTFRHLLLGFSVVSFFAYGVANWQPAFFMRSYGLNTGELGTWFAVIYGVGGILGTYAGGAWATRRAANNERLQLRVVALMYCGFAVISGLTYLSTNPHLSFWLMGVGSVGVSTATGPIFATIQTLVPPRMRATSIAIIYLFANLIGMGLGPLAVGALSDAFHPWAREESLRYALLALCPGYFGAVWYLWQGSRTVTEDLILLKAADRDADPVYCADLSN